MAGMFGFFGGGSKPGKGIDKDEPPKRRFFIFFDVLIRKFFKIAQINMLYVLVSLPYLVLLFSLSPFNIDMVKSLPNLDMDQLLSGIGSVGEGWLDVAMRMMFAFFIVTFWGSGPASAGMGKVLRNYSKESHSWIWSDFWQEFKSNFKQGMIVLIVDMVVIFLATQAFMVYGGMYSLNGNSMMILIQLVLCLALVIYTFMHGYIYQLMITYEGGMKSIYRNSFLFTLVKFPQNLALTVVSMAIFFFMYISLESLGAAMSALLLTALCTFIICFYTSGAIKSTVDAELKKKNKQ